MTSCLLCTQFPCNYDGTLAIYISIHNCLRHTYLVLKTFLFMFPDVREYCEWESFNATCGPDEVIMIHSARYGRMNLGRCVTQNYGNIGCGSDVTAEFDAQCSGRHQCLITVISLHNKRSCPKDFKSYVEAGYHCQKGKVTFLSFLVLIL